MRVVHRPHFIRTPRKRQRHSRFGSKSLAPPTLHRQPFLPVQPIHIDRSQNVTGAVVPTGPPVGTAFVFFAVRLRAGPSSQFQTLTIIPFNVNITIYGRNATRTWYKVGYNGLYGWVAAAFIRPNDLKASQIPVVK